MISEFIHAVVAHGQHAQSVLKFVTFVCCGLTLRGRAREEQVSKTIVSLNKVQTVLS